MKHTKSLLFSLLAAALLLLSSCYPERQEPLPHLVGLMTGSFSSQAQAEANEDFHDIRLEMVEIWGDREDGPWIYVEQAAAGYLDEPYRQRVYRLIQLERDRFESKTYTIPDPLRFAGDWRSEDPLSGLTPDSLSLREGCSVYLKMSDDGHFVGSTEDKSCPSDLQGASYATSEVMITDHGMATWDRGYDGDGNQVWGSRSGGYRFDRIRE